MHFRFRSPGTDEHCGRELKTTRFREKIGAGMGRATAGARPKVRGYILRASRRGARELGRIDENCRSASGAGDLR